MVMYEVILRRKGQITIPAPIRAEIGLKEGDRLLIHSRGQEIILVAPADVVDPTAGAFREYTKGEFLTPDQIREIAAQSIADEVMTKMEEIERDRRNHVH